MTQPETSDFREGLVDYPDGRDWKCTACGETVPDSPELEHDCSSQLERVNRAFFWLGELGEENRNDVVVEYAYVGEVWEDDE